MKMEAYIMNWSHGSCNFGFWTTNHMQKNKKIFLLLFVLFMLVILYVSYDISRRTTFPGSKGNLKERISTEVEADKK